MYAVPQHNNTVVKTLIAVAGSQKTRTLASEAVCNMSAVQTVFAVRTIKNAKMLEAALHEKLMEHALPTSPSECIYRVDSEETKSGKVNQKLEKALGNDCVRIIIITHKTLVDFRKWDRYATSRVLNIDELPPALQMAEHSFGDQQLKALGVSMADHGKMPDSLFSGLLRERAAQLYAEDIPNDPVYSPKTLALLNVMSKADPDCISVKLKASAEKLNIAAIVLSGVFYALKCFKEVRLATMLLTGSFFETIGQAQGITFVDFPWGNQNKAFEHDHKVTLYVMSESSASKYRLNSEDQENGTMFNGIVKRVLTIPAFRESQQNILFYANKDSSSNERWSALGNLGVQERFEQMPYDCHGHNEWEKSRTHLALLLTSKWNPAYDECGKQMAMKLGIHFDDLKSAYEVSQMFEPTAQAATRGVVRSDCSTGPDSHIAVIDQDMAAWLREHVFPRAKICSDYMITTPRQVSPLAGWRGVAKQRLSLTDTEAKWVGRNIVKMEASFGFTLDQTNTQHIELVRQYMDTHRKPRIAKAA
jgi:hypothetical protein